MLCSLHSAHPSLSLPLSSFPFNKQQSEPPLGLSAFPLVISALGQTLAPLSIRRTELQLEGCFALGFHVFHVTICQDDSDNRIPLARLSSFRMTISSSCYSDVTTRAGLCHIQLRNLVIASPRGHSSRGPSHLFFETKCTLSYGSLFTDRRKARGNTRSLVNKHPSPVIKVSRA